MTNTEQIGVVAVTPAVSQADIEALEKLYLFREPAEILQFLEKYPFLVPLLFEAIDPIRQQFPDSPLFLQYLPDPEIDYPLLMIYIGTELDADEAVERLDKVDDWWVEIANRDEGKLCIDVEFL